MHFVAGSTWIQSCQSSRWRGRKRVCKYSSMMLRYSLQVYMCNLCITFVILFTQTGYMSQRLFIKYQLHWHIVYFTFFLQQNLLNLNVAACYLKMGDGRKSIETCNKVSCFIVKNSYDLNIWLLILTYTNCEELIIRE